MSLYQVQKLIYHVNRDPERRERYRQDTSGFVPWATGCGLVEFSQ
jgi:hypothetical protein